MCTSYYKRKINYTWPKQAQEVKFSRKTNKINHPTSDVSRMIFILVHQYRHPNYIMMPKKENIFFFTLICSITGYVSF